MAIDTRNTAEPYVLQPGEGDTLKELRIRFLSDDASSAGVMTAIECVNPGPGGPPMHVHHSHDECYYVIAGRYRFRFGDRDYDGGPGTFVYAPRGTVHTFASIGPDEGRVLCLVFPAGFEACLRRMAELDRSGASSEEYVALFPEFDFEMVGPGLI